MDKNLFFS